MKIVKAAATTWRSLFSCWLLFTAFDAKACEEVLRSIGIGYRFLDSELSEYSSTGKQLVKEHGTLDGLGVNASISCDKWTFEGEYLTSEGARNYTGQSSLGAPLSTSSRIVDNTFGASIYRKITSSWQLGVDVSQQRTTREIVGTLTVAGYPETYDKLMTRIGTRWSVVTDWGRWTLAGAMSVSGEQMMSLRLPGKDITNLKFTEPKQWELGIHWRQDLGDKFYVAASYRYINTEIEQSKYGVVTSNGIPVAVAYQPRTSLTERPLFIAFGRTF